MVARRPGPGKDRRPRPRERRRSDPPPVGTLEHFEWWANRTKVLILKRPRLFVLEPFQRQALRDYFRGARETLLLLPKGNGKTTLLALLALYHLCVQPHADVIVAAAGEKQAAQLYRYAATIVLLNPGLKKDRLKVHKTHRIEHRTLYGQLRIVPADADTVDGSAATLVIVDEIHRHKDGGALYQTLRDGLRKQGGQLVGISTAGWDPLSVLGQARANALKHVVEHEDAYTYCLTDDGQFAMHEWALDPDVHDPESMEHVKLANPLSAITIESLAEDRGPPTQTRHDWLRYRCNIWIQTHEAAIPRDEWNACAVPGIDISDDAETVWVCIDLAWRKDTTAIVPMAIDPTAPRHEDCTLDLPRVVVGRPTVRAPPGDDLPIPYSSMEAAVTTMIHRYGTDRCKVVFDPRVGGDQLLRDVHEKLKIDVVQQRQNGPEPADCASKLFELIRDRRLAHPDDRSMNEQVLYATARWIAGTDLWRFDKGPSGQPNDCALAMSFGARQLAVPPEPVLEPFAFTA
ncbi:MAG: terminase large subunit [Solirubrobacteraceae bacterium]|nr:terminase large subunit [Solirubrobacteraceae bacterium]